MPALVAQWRALGADERARSCARCEPSTRTRPRSGRRALSDHELSRTTREIRTDYLARVEGEGAMLVRVRGDEVEEVQFKIFEPPRFFEALLRGRQFTEAPDITARICGICPIAYIASSCNAMEARLRRSSSPSRCGCCAGSSTAASGSRATCCTSAMLHAPDFLGYDGAVELARDRRDLVETALRLKKAGNEVMRVIGGREVHPVNLRVGGVYRAPSRAELRGARARARVGARRGGRADALGGGLRLPRLRAGLRVRRAAPAGRVRDRARPHRLEHGSRHRRLRVRAALHRERTSSARTRCTRRSPASATTSSARSPATRSNSRRALAARARGRGRGRPRRRSSATRSAASSCARSRPSTPPTRRCGSSPRTSRPSRRSSRRCPAPAPATAAPRRRAGSAGTATRSTPRARSSTRRSCRRPRRTRRRSRRTCSASSAARSHLSDDELAHRCEQTIRNYDPCISCATHFLRLEVERV